MKKKLNPYCKDSPFHFPQLTGWIIDNDQNTDFNAPLRYPLYTSPSQMLDPLFSHKKISTQPTKMPNQHHRYSNIERKSKCYTKLPEKNTQSNILKAKLYLKTEKNLQKFGKIKQEALKLQENKPINRKYSHLVKNKSERNLQHYQVPINLSIKSKYLNFPSKNQHTRQNSKNSKPLLDHIQIKTKQIKFSQQNLLKGKLKFQMEETDRAQLQLIKTKEDTIQTQSKQQNKKRQKMISSNNPQLLLGEFNDDLIFVKRN